MALVDADESQSAADESLWSHIKLIANARWRSDIDRRECDECVACAIGSRYARCSCLAVVRRCNEWIDDRMLARLSRCGSLSRSTIGRLSKRFCLVFIFNISLFLFCQRLLVKLLAQCNLLRRQLTTMTTTIKKWMMGCCSNRIELVHEHRLLSPMSSPTVSLVLPGIFFGRLLCYAFAVFVEIRL